MRRVTSAPWKIGVGPQRVAPPAPRRFRRGGKRGKRGGPRFLDSGITRVAARLWVRGDAVSGACSAWPAGWFGWLKAGRRPSPNSVALASARRQGAARLLRFAPALRVPWRSARAFYGGVMAGSSDPASSRVPSPAVASRWRWPSASAERAAPSGSSTVAHRDEEDREGTGRVLEDKEGRLTATVDHSPAGAATDQLRTPENAAAHQHVRGDASQTVTHVSGSNCYPCLVRTRPTRNDGSDRRAIRAIHPWEKCPARAQTTRCGAGVTLRAGRGAFPTGG